MELLVQKKTSLYTLNWGLRLNVFSDLNLKTVLKVRKKGILFTGVSGNKRTTYIHLLEGPAHAS